LKGQPAQILQHQQRPRLVGGIVRDGDRAPLFQRLQIRQLAGVEPHGAGRHLGNGGERQTAIPGEAVQIGLVLEAVHVERAVGQGDVGGHVIGEFHQLDLVTLGLELGLDGVGHHVGEVPDRGADDDLLLGRIGGQDGEGQAAGQQGQGGEGEEGTTLHRNSLST